MVTQTPEKFEPLNHYFWRSDDDYRICSPWLWLGHSYRLSSADDEDRVRNAVRNNPLYRIIASRVFFVVIFILFLTAHNYYDAPDNYWIFYVIAIVSVYILISALVKTYIWYLVRKLEFHDQKMEYQEYFINAVDSKGSDSHLSDMKSMVYVSLLFLCLLLFSDSDAKNTLALAIVAFQVGLLSMIGVMRMYCRAQTTTKVVEDHNDHSTSLQSDVPNGLA